MPFHRVRPARTRPSHGRPDHTVRGSRATVFGPVAALVLALLAPLPASATGCTLEGLGTGDEPWQVATAADLALVGQGDCGLDGDYLQTADITLTGYWTPIGNFTGAYDGGGRTITGLTFDLGSTDYVGMFVELRGTIHDVHLLDVSVTGRTGVGGLVGQNVTGTITQSSVAGTVTGQSSVGGLVGQNLNGTITQSSAAGTVTGRDAVGGLVGSNLGTIRRASASATVTFTPATTLQQFGGLVGINSGRIEFSFATGDVTSDGGMTGGLVGENRSAGVVANSYARGAVSGSSRSFPGVGGLVGWEAGGSVARSFATGAVTDGATAPWTPSRGGLVGGGPDTEENTLIDRVIDSVWDKDTSGVDAFPGADPGDGLTTAEMKSFATYDDRGWAIEATCDGGGFDASTAVWGICPTINDGYPYLRWNVAPTSSSGSTTTAAASTPVRVAGALPSLPAGDATWNRADGTITPLTATAPAARTVTYRDAASTIGVRVTGASGTSVGNGVFTEVGGALVSEVCADLAVGSVIEVWVMSEPRLVAAHRVTDDDCQTFIVPLATPLDGGGTVAAGTHTLQFALPSATGMTAVDIGMTIGGPIPTSVPAGEGPRPTRWPLVLTLSAALTVGLARGRGEAVDGPEDRTMASWV